MTAVIAFPTPPNRAAQLAAQDNALDMARRIIRGKAHHAADDLRLACHTLMTYGDSFDWMDGYHVLRAMDLPPAPQTPPRRGTIRGVALGAALTLLATWVGLTVVLSIRMPM